MSGITDSPIQGQTTNLVGGKNGTQTQQKISNQLDHSYRTPPQGESATKTNETAKTILKWRVGEKPGTSERQKSCNASPSISDKLRNLVSLLLPNRFQKLKTEAKKAEKPPQKAFLSNNRTFKVHGESISFNETLGKLEKMNPKEIEMLIDTLDKKEGLELIKQSMLKDATDKTPTQNELKTAGALFLRGTSTTAKLISAYQKKLLGSSFNNEINEIYKSLPKERGSLADDNYIKEIKSSVEQTLEVIDQISLSDKFPSEIKELNKFTKDLLTKREVNSELANNYGGTQFFMLRFLNPLIASQPGGMDVSKVLQNLSNNVQYDVKQQPVMLPFNEAFKENAQKLNNALLRLSN